MSPSTSAAARRESGPGGKRDNEKPPRDVRHLEAQSDALLLISSTLTRSQ